jgi:putative cell wall-binding protein
MTTQRVYILRRAGSAALAAALAFAVLAATPSALADTSLDPSVEAQQMVYEVNLARWNPPAFAGLPGNSDVLFPDGQLARPPQAINAQLSASSMFKANELSDFEYWAHQSGVTGMWPNELAREFGFPLPSWWMNDANYIESLHVGSSDPIRVVASFARSPGHRAHVFGEGGWSDWNEIGIGRSTNGDYWSIHSAYREPTRTFVTGVVFDDLDGDGRMDMGEGVGGVTVRIGAATATTNAGGGYAVVRGPGTYSASAEGAGATAVEVGQYNVGVDFIMGSPTPTVRAYELCEGEAPTMLGTSGDDILYATAARDVIHGLDGDDLVVGAGPNDVICSAKTGATERLAGPDRFATAAAISQATHPDGSAVVFVAVGTNYPDAIAAGSAAAQSDAPILLVRDSQLPDVTAAELKRLDPELVVVLGGTAAIDQGVASQIAEVVPNADIERHAGPDRFATAAEVSRRAFTSDTEAVYVVSGYDFATALAAAPAAIAAGSPILLVPRAEVPATVIAELERLDPDRIVVVGDASAISESVVDTLKTLSPTVTRIATATGYAASVAVSRDTFEPGIATVYIAVGDRFPDALAGGAATRLSPGPVLLVTSNHVSAGVSAELSRLAPEQIVIFGGPAAVSDSVEAILGTFVAAP